MRYTDEAQTTIEVSPEEGADLGAPNGGFFPVALFVERGGDLDAVLPYEAPPPDLPRERASSVAAISAASQAVRVRVAPYINYMDTEYQVLASQADAYVAANRPENPVGLDMLVQSAEDSGRTVSEEADLVRSKRDAYIALLNATRSLRRQGAAAIDAATDIETIHSVRDQYVGQLASL